MVTVTDAVGEGEGLPGLPGLPPEPGGAIVALPFPPPHEAKPRRAQQEWKTSREIQLRRTHAVSSLWLQPFGGSQPAFVVSPGVIRGYL